jgi:hypothetical protein
MFLQVTVAAAFLASSVLAAPQVYGPPPGGNSGSSSTSSAAATVPSAPASTSSQINVSVLPLCHMPHVLNGAQVDVAPNGQFVFNPNNFTAANG